LRDASKRTDLFDTIKWIPLLKDGAWFLTLGGELRERVQAVRNPAFGLPSPMSNIDVFHRTFLFTDLHLGPHLRTFVEFVNGETRGSTTKPSTFEQDPLDVLQAFADVMVPVGNSDFTLRVGRQQLTFGSARLVSFREAPNVRRAFDGGRAFWKANEGHVSTAASAVRAVGDRRSRGDHVLESNQRHPHDWHAGVPAHALRHGPLARDDAARARRPTAGAGFGKPHALNFAAARTVRRTKDPEMFTVVNAGMTRS
jgi:hypothetical protein